MQVRKKEKAKKFAVYSEIIIHIGLLFERDA